MVVKVERSKVERKAVKVLNEAIAGSLITLFATIAGRLVCSGCRVTVLLVRLFVVV